MRTPEEELHFRLQTLHDTLPPKLPSIPKSLVELSRNQKKLLEIRELNKHHEEMTENEKKYQGIALESFRKALVDLDIMHKKAVVELKSIEPKIARLRELENEE